MTVFYEEEYVERLLNSTEQKRASYKDLSLIARYLKSKLGKNKTQIYNDLVEFCEYHNPEFNEVLAHRRLKSAVRSVDRYDLRSRIDIPVTKAEMESIRNAVTDYKRQKVLFAMLVISKFEHHREHIKKRKSTRYDENYYTNQRLTKILKMAKVHVSRKERYKILYDLEHTGLITTTMVGSFQINFVNTDSEIEVLITDLNDIESFFPYHCISCGKIYERSPYSKNQLCDKCYQEKRAEDVRKNMRKYDRKLKED